MAYRDTPHGEKLNEREGDRKIEHMLTRIFLYRDHSGNRYAFFSPYEYFPDNCGLISAIRITTTIIYELDMVTGD